MSIIIVFTNRYEWQGRHQQGPGTELFPLNDAAYTTRVRGYKRESGMLDEPQLVLSDDEETDEKDK